MTAKILEGKALNYVPEATSLGHFFFNYAEKHGDQICQVDGTINKTETYSSVKQRSTRLAIALQKKGVTSDDVITFCSSNTLDVTVSIIATFYLGAKVGNLEPSLSARLTNHLLKLVTPKIVFVEETSVDLIEESLKDTTLQTEIIVLGQSTKYTTFSDLVKPQEDEENFRPVNVDINDVAVLFFSSGTTGLPKAICHSSRTFMIITQQAYETGFHSALFHMSTFYWMTAIMMLTCAFKVGTYRVFCRNPTTEDIFRIIHQYKVATAFLAPILTYPLTNFNNSEKYDISSVQLLVTGGTPLAPSQLRKLSDLFKNANVSSAYGMSEVGWITAFDHKLSKEFIQTKPKSCGSPAVGLRIKVVDLDTNQLLGPNQKGEIHVLSPAVMTGYYKADSSGNFDKEGFLKTGDIGYYDEDGYIYIIERIKEMFKYRSWHIVPSFIESILIEHPAVKESVVFGIPHDEDGEIPAACIVLKENCNVTTEEIHKFLEERVADREKLRGGITFVKALLKTPSGKVIRKEMRNMFLKCNV